MRVEVRGKIYPSVPACAEALGVSVATVYCALSRRTTETLGLGAGNRTSRRGGIPKQPIVIGGLRFDSLAAASRALGFNRRYVQTVLSKGGERARANLLRAAMEYRARLDARAMKERAR